MRRTAGATGLFFVRMAQVSTADRAHANACVIRTALQWFRNPGTSEDSVTASGHFFRVVADAVLDGAEVPYWLKLLIW